jgi:hypothetical protein
MKELVGAEIMYFGLQSKIYAEVAEWLTRRSHEASFSERSPERSREGKTGTQEFSLK